MNEIPYASLEEDVSSQNGDKRGRKWTRKQRALGVTFILLLLVVTAGVVVGICTKGTNDVPTPTSTPISTTTKASTPAVTTQSTTVTPETIETERTTVTLSTTVIPKTTPARKTTVTTKSVGTTPETSRSWSAPETSRALSTPIPTGSPTSPNKTASSCEDGSNIIFFISYRTVGKLLETRTAKSMSECTHHCAQSKDCAMLEHYNTTCNFFEEGSIHTPELRWALTKACVKSDQVCQEYFQFVVVEQSSLTASVGEMVPAEKIEDCFASCLNANVTFGFECRSAQFYPLDKECFLNTEEQNGLATTNLINMTETTSIYMNNACAYFSDENGIIPCAEDTTPAFIRAPNMRLVAFAFHVKLDSRNVAECLHLCEDTNEEHDDRYVCKSVMYYYNEKECILNSETRESKPDLFIPESEEIKVDYFDVTRYINNKTCERSSRTRQEVHPEAWTKLRHEDEHSAECFLIEVVSRSSLRTMSYPEIYMDDGPYASLNDNDSSQFEYKRIWSKKQVIGVAVFLLVLVVTSGVLIGICTRGHRSNDDVHLTVPAPSATNNTVIPTTAAPYPTICAPSFVRASQMILNSTRHEEQMAGSVTECLRMCAYPPREVNNYGFVCKAVNYYYERKRCVLFSENSEEMSDLLIPVAEIDIYSNIKIDYFDVSRYLVKKTCPEESQLKSINALEKWAPEEVTRMEHLNGNMTIVPPSVHRTPRNVSFADPEKTEIVEKRNTYMTHCSRQVENFLKRHKSGISNLLCFIIFVALVVTIVVFCRSKDNFKMSLLPTGITSVEPVNATLGKAEGIPLYLGFTLRITAQFYHPGHQLRVDLFQAEVRDGNKNLGETDLISVYDTSAPSTPSLRIVQEGFVTFITLNVNAFMHRGDYERFNECDTRIRLNFRYRVQFFAETAHTKYFEEILSLKCTENVTVINH